MVPKKATELGNEFADKKGIPRAHMLDMLTFYYRDIRTACSKLEHPNVAIRGLAFMRPSVPKLRKGITGTNKWLKEFDKTGRDKSELYYEKKKNAVLMNKMIDTCLEKRKAYQLVKKLRRL